MQFYIEIADLSLCPWGKEVIQNNNNNLVGEKVGFMQ